MKTNTDPQQTGLPTRQSGTPLRMSMTQLERHPGPSPPRMAVESPQDDELAPPPNSTKPSWAREPGPFEDLWITPLVGITVLIWIRLLMAAVGVMPLL